MIVSAIVFLVVLFLIRNTSLFKKTAGLVLNNQEGLTYNTTIGELVEKDTDGDGIPDWEEPLYGLDPTTKETIPGIPDTTTINKLKAEQGIGTTDKSGQNPENLTQTEKFSQELFSTVASLSQNGAMDQAMVDQISNSLADKIKNSTPKIVFTLSDIKTINDDSLKAIKNYSDAMLNIQKKYPDKGNVFDILQRFVIDASSATVDSSVLPELDPVITQTQNTIDAILKVSVPNSLSTLHLNFINAGEILMENIKDMRLFDTDPVLSLGAMSKYEENITSFQTALTSLMNAVNKKLGN